MGARPLLIGGAIALAISATPAQAAATGGTIAPRTEPAAASTGGVSVNAWAPKAVQPKKRKPAKRKPAKRRAAAKPKPAPPTKPPVIRTHGFAFPIAGAHSFGAEDALFGAPRRGHVHQGQDVMAAAGTPLVAVTRATVIYKAHQAGGAGHYVVLHGTDGRDYVYMHMIAPTPLAKGTAVSAGEQVGQVGSTGSSDGAHLHFEIWVGGWYAKGGAPIDPLPELQAWSTRR